MNKKRIFFWFLNILLIISIFSIFIYRLGSAPSSNRDVTIHINQGDSLEKITEELELRKVVKDKDLLLSLIKIISRDRGIKTGDYLFYKNSFVWNVALQISLGVHNIEPIRITLREGLDRNQMANILADKLSGFRKDLFLEQTKDKEGYLFPDTYFFFPMSSTEEIVKELTSNFDRRIQKLEEEINKSKRTKEEIIIMASIIELEASGKDDAYLISGILWRRLDIGMMLQVDVDRNTYKEKGLPKEPLGNPGLISIEASLRPESSKYLYYIHDKERRTHFAQSYNEHKNNIDKYLR